MFENSQICQVKEKPMDINGLSKRKSKQTNALKHIKLGWWLKGLLNNMV
jgi:hypothetical protein